MSDSEGEAGDSGVFLLRGSLIDWELLEDDFEAESEEAYSQNLFADQQSMADDDDDADDDGDEFKTALAQQAVEHVAAVAANTNDWKQIKGLTEELDSCGGGPGNAYRYQWISQASNARLALYSWPMEHNLLLVLDAPDRQFAVTAGVAGESPFVRTSSFYRRPQCGSVQQAEMTLTQLPTDNEHRLVPAFVLTLLTSAITSFAV
jgi:hypothetical protein